MPLYNSDLEEIKSRLDIVDVISEYIPLKKAGQNWKGLCPFHSEKTPSFMVSPSKQIFHCFGCGIGGDVFTFLIKYENLSFNESLNILAKKAGVALEKSRRRALAAGEKENLLNLHRDALLFYQQQLKQNPDAEAYLKNRGITDGAQKLFSIGFAPDKWEALFSYLKKKGYKAETITKAGLITHGARGYYDTFRNRIIFPIFDLRGDVIAFGGRVMDDSMPKYLNSPDTPVFNKGRILYGLNLAKESIKKAGFAIFVEGYLDVITTHTHGFSNVVAPLGTALTLEHGKLIRRLTQEAVIVFDGDASGVKAAKSAIGILLEGGLDVKVLLLPEGEDPDSILKTKGKKTFTDLLAKAVSIVDFFIMQFRVDSRRQVVPTYEEGDRHLIANEALETISKIPNSVLQGHYAMMLSEKLKINELFIREELRKIRKRQQPRYAMQRPKGKNKDTSEIKPRAKPLDEIYLLQLILQFPEKAEQVLNAVSAEDFKNPTIRTVFKKMRDGLISYNNLISECDEDAKNLLTELAFKTDIDEPEKIFRDCLSRLKSKRLQVLLYKVQDKIKKAEMDKNKTLLKTLLIEKQRLLRLKDTDVKK